jgi:hypothetical protein
MAYGQQRRINLANPGVGWTADASTGAAAPTGDREQDGEPPGNPPDGKGALSAGAPDSERQSARKPRESTFYVRPSRLPPGLPEWFTRRDGDGDGQISLSEFAPNPTQADLEEFARYDKNGDGFITVRECLDALRPARPPAKRPSSKSADKSTNQAGAGKPNS